MPLIRCKAGGEMLDVPEGRDPHTALDANGCGHCADGHGPDIHCGQNAETCWQARVAGNPLHEGPCWNPPDISDRPEGCTVCRPVTFMGNVGVTLTVGG